MRRGRFVTFEGIDGAGKTTALTYVAYQLQARGIAFLSSREPGGTKIGESLRELLKVEGDESPVADAETLLVFAARAQHVAKVIRPQLEGGLWILCDRFTDATYAYQGGGRGVASERIRILEEWVQQGLRPDRTLFFDVTVAEGLQRRRRAGRVDDRFEGEEGSLLERVRAAYQVRARAEPERVRWIQAGRDWPEVARALDDWLESELTEWGKDG